MKTYNSFIGIDIGKFNFVVAIYNQRSIKTYDNNSTGIAEFVEDYQSVLSSGLCVLETTGGYEMNVLMALCEKQFDVHRANTRHVKNFIRSWGNAAKTDALDAKALALYASERHQSLNCFKPSSKKMIELFELTQRRNDLKQFLVAEKNRSHTSNCKHVKASQTKTLAFIIKQIDILTEKINSIIDEDKHLAEKKKVLKTIPGVGNIVANDLLILLPEIGSLNRRQIASLAGLAPKANDSGNRFGYRMTNKGRATIKPILFIAAMAARNSQSHLKDFYLKLIEKGKKKMVALTALMKKLSLLPMLRLEI